MIMGAISFGKRQNQSALLFFLFIFLLISCQKSPNLDQTTILIVDEEKVSIDRFRDIYELDPAFPGYRKGEPGLKEYLEVIIDKYLAEKLARQEGILDSLSYQRRLNFERQKSIIQAFYRKEISNKIQVSEDELRDAYYKMGIKLQVKHLFSPEKSQAENAYQALLKGVPFDSLADKFFMNVDPQRGGADLGEFGWGELEPSLEDTLYQLKPGEYSKPVKSRWGYHIFLITNRGQEMMSSENDFQKKRNRIFKKLRKRKEEAAAGKYLKEYLDPTQIKVKIEAFLKIAQVLGIYDENRPQANFEKFRPFTDEHISMLKAMLSSELSQLFMSSNKFNWSIKDFLNRVSKLPLEHRPQLSSLGRFKDDIGLMIRNEFLMQEAMQHGAHKSAEVDSTVREYAKEIAYNHYLKNTYQNMEVPQEVIDYFDLSSRERNRKRPNDILPGISTIESYRYYHAGRELHRKLALKFPNIMIQMNTELIAQESRNIDWDNPLRMFVAQKN